MHVVGADGCKSGWFYVCLSPSQSSWGVVRTAAELLALEPSPDLVLIDVPIGLRDGGPEERRCDLAARKLLGAKRASSVFRAPCRPAVLATSYAAASETNFLLTGKRLSQQSWRIAAKIAEVDALMRSDPEARRRFREVHPEVLFWSLAGGRAMAFKKSRTAGRAERREILLRAHADVQVILSGVGKRAPAGVAWDDVIDALACAVTGAICGEL